MLAARLRAAAFTAGAAALLFGAFAPVHADVRVVPNSVHAGVGMAAFRLRAATFQGPMASDRKSGDTDDSGGSCNEGLVSGTGPGAVTCHVTWTLSGVKDICHVDTGQKAGSAEFYSATNTSSPNHFGPITLNGAGEDGSGVLTGYGLDVNSDKLMHITIDASDVCGAVDLARDLAGLELGVNGGKFTGHVDAY